jgi:cyclase
MLPRRRALGLLTGAAFLAATGPKGFGATDPQKIPDAQLRELPFQQFTDFSKLEIRALPAGPRAFVLTDAGGRIGGMVTAWIGPRETVLVDSAYPQAVPAIRAVLASLNAPPVAYVINTHWHVDHTDGDTEWIKPTGSGAGARIVAHANVRARRSTRQEIRSFGASYPPLPDDALPQMTYARTMALPVSGETVVLHHAQGHTDGDSIVHFHDANVIVLGDLSFGRQYPFIDAPSGGGWPTLIAAIDQVLARGNPTTRFVPGHVLPTDTRSPILSYTDLQEYRQMLGVVDQRVRTAIRRGVTLKELLDQRPLKDLEGQWLRTAAVSSAFIATTAYVTIQRDG